MGLKYFVHGLVLALCSMGTVLAAKDSRTDIGAVQNQKLVTDTNVAIDTTVAGASDSLSMKHQSPGTRQRMLVADAGDKVKAKSQSVSVNSGKKKELANFQELDIEAEKVMRDVLDLSSDLAIIDEQNNNPPKNQLLVLVTLQPSKFFELDFVELKIDNQIVAAHPYTEKDISAMVRGGGHKLYLANLPAGTHELVAKFVGKVPRDPDYRREAAFKFIAGVNRTLIELYINSGDNSSFPQFTIREWN